jgi:DNA polymerase-3 subunit gamma/tau
MTYSPAFDRSAVSSTAPHQALYRRWRAQTFSQIVGQTAVVETLRNAVRSGRVSHATLFVGPRGTGKTSLARILAKALNCTDLQDGDPCDRCEACTSIREGRALDLVEIDAASNRGIGDIRELRDRINYAPTDLRRKVYILDEAHQITKDAWNALLKSLEEPPEFVAFMFASTHPQDFPPAILSRLQRYDVRRLSVEEIEGKLGRILAAESIEAEPGAIHLIARLAAGGMRDAESMLDQLLATAGGRIEEAGVRDLLGLADSDAVDRLVNALLGHDPAAGIAVLDELDERGRDVSVVLDQIVDSVRERLAGGLASQADPAALRRLAAVGRRLAAIDPERRNVGGLRLQVELALFEPAPAVASVDAEAVSVAVVAPHRPRPSEPRRAGPEPVRPAPQPSAGPAAPAVAAAAPAVAAAASPEATSPLPAAPEPDDVPPVPAPAEPQATAPVASPEIERLVAGWSEIVASVRPATRAIITECRPIALDGNVVTLGFPEAKAFLKDVADRKRADLESAVGGFLGRAVAVRCVATNIDLVAAPPADDEGSFVLAEARRIFADDLADVGEIS